MEPLYLDVLYHALGKEECERIYLAYCLEQTRKRNHDQALFELVDDVKKKVDAELLKPGL